MQKNIIFLCDIRMEKDKIDYDGVNEEQLKKLVAELGHPPNKHWRLHAQSSEHYQTILNLFDTAIADTPQVAPTRVSQATDNRKPIFNSIVAEVFGVSTTVSTDEEVVKPATVANSRKRSSQPDFENSHSNRKKVNPCEGGDGLADDGVGCRPTKKPRSVSAV